MPPCMLQLVTKGTITSLGYCWGLLAQEKHVCQLVLARFIPLLLNLTSH